MMKEIIEFNNNFGSVVIFGEDVGFSVRYSLKKTPWCYRCRVHNTDNYDAALRHYRHYVGILKRQETVATKKSMMH